MVFRHQLQHVDSCTVKVLKHRVIFVASVSAQCSMTSTNLVTSRYCSSDTTSLVAHIDRPNTDGTKP